ncbi:HWE histidine kinase domain-containing protein [Roseobacter sinensis]|uniref:histidine kinase n=1 Tax=Roseobacter sinensis TaxID=2931391 RepID=A0ABT3BGP7_9RHOB|nr:HWE histidine kinase domain-containing protein [Roseobacter sp. WL0113]MCV3272752.1 GAF domain-containing protein [Roseobacter sp. WL0113]
MTSNLSSQEVLEALESCASEPIHIPGIVQPFGCLLAVDKQSMTLVTASTNTEQFLSLPYQALLGRKLNDILGSEAWHELRNVQTQEDLLNSSVIVGDFQMGEQLLTLHASEQEGMLILEFEKAGAPEFSGSNILKTISFLTRKIEACDSEQALFDISTRLLRHLTEYDRVMIYRFDSAFNGEVLAEDRHRAMPSFEGLRFPHWDIPPQARAMMEKIPLRFIVDAHQEPVSLASSDPEADPLDISLAVTRGVSSVHMEYLHNMGVESTMTLTIKLEDQLWGIISFHHRTPRLISAQLRAVLISVARMFSAKLQVLQQKSYLAMVSRVDDYKDEILGNLTNDSGFEKFGSMVVDILGACGLIVVQADQQRAFGTVPSAEVCAALEATLADDVDFGQFENLESVFPDLSDHLNGCAGALVFSPSSDRTLFVFREEIERQVSWAGDPVKHAQTHQRRLRLSPRGSFATYLENVRGMSAPWSAQDLYFARRVWTLINSMDRSELISSLNRQQKIMIDELNHRVRNILSLVRSVSQQAQNSSYGSLNSYSRSLEARIEALAASHDLASGSLTSAVPVEELVRREFEPYLVQNSGRLLLSGESRDIRPDISPIFSLVIHELVTNAVKYGALSTQDGEVAIRLERASDGLLVHWVETGGPSVQAPNALGFGTTLIREAIPFELNGEAELDFEAAGVTARLKLPDACFELGHVEIDKSTRRDLTSMSDNHFREISDTASCLLLEDNFVIAMGTSDQIQKLGVETVDVVANVAAAIEYLEALEPTFAILDISLAGGETSIPFAEILAKRRIPFIFVTGFGDSDQLPVALKDTIKLTKPATDAELRDAIGELLLRKSGALS